MHAKLLKIRCSERKEIILPARCRSRSGFVNHVVITNLSAEGCRIESHGLTVGEEDLVTLRPEGLEGLVGEIRWRRNHKAGIRFVQPLYAPVVDHLVQAHAQFAERPAQGPAPALRHAA